MRLVILLEMLDIGLLVLFYIVALRGKSNVMKRKTSFFCEEPPCSFRDGRLYLG
jgi:hypothetical protein